MTLVGNMPGATIMRPWGLCLLIGLAVTIPAQASDGIREQRVHFKTGAEGATLKGQLRGDSDIDYVLGAMAGQRMTVELHSNNPQNYFNILPPGSEEALFVGSSAGNRFAGTLPTSGDYRIRVYLMRAAARRGETASYRLTVKIGGGGNTGSAAPGGDFADGLAGGPDFWEVTGVADDDLLNLRSGPSSRDRKVIGVGNGTVLRNHGCEMHAGQRWCRVSMRDAPSRRGWVAGRYLRESSQ
jgi:hypothetical protein